MSTAALNFGKSSGLPLILQEETAECGHACVAMVSNFLGHSIDLYALRKISPPSKRGVNLLNINQLLMQLDMTPRALRVPLEELNWVKCPAILHWNMNHFVVLKKVTKNYIVIHDPALGIRKCSREEVSKCFTGIVVEVDKAAEFNAIQDKKNLTLLDIAKATRGFTPFMGLLILISLSLELMNLLNPLFMQYVTDNVLSTTDSSNLSVVAIAFIFLLFLQVLTEYVRGHMVIYISNHLTEQFSSNVVRHLLKLPLDFFEKRHKGDIQSKFQSIDTIQKKMSTDFINTVLDGLIIVINLLVMVIYSVYLTLVVLLALAVYTGIRYLSYYHLKKHTETSINQHAQTASLFLETLQGIIPIKAFLKESTRFNYWRNAYIKSLNADIGVSKMNLIYSVANQLVFNAEHIAVVCMGAFLVLASQFSLGMLMAFLAYRILLVNKASSFIQNLFEYQLISIQLRRLSDILFQEPEIMTSGGGRDETLQGHLELRNICFRYNPNENLILNKINLQIRAGEKVAIVGASGCGKSTFLKVVMGLLNKTAGEIYIDNRTIEDFGLKNYRELTASVMQEDTLLSGTILDNIAFFDENIDREQVYHVAKLAFIHEVIVALPMGYETLVGDMGSGLSGGQKQRILLARALYKNPKLLFLDEATSHLDAENEKNINQSLKSLQITQIIIAHRQETIAMADRVIDFKSINKRDGH